MNYVGETEEIFAELLEVKINRVKNWAYNRNIIKGSSLLAQYAKAQSEMGELADAILKGNKNEFEDAMGDTLVCLINLCEMAQSSFGVCLDAAWSEIKDRNGIMFQGVFVKESDENYDKIVAKTKNNMVYEK